MALDSVDRTTRYGLVAFRDLLGEKYFFGVLGLQKDMRRAVELWTEAAELDSIQALFNLGVAYEHGNGVEQDTAKAAEFYTKAATRTYLCPHQSWLY